ncbi:hypothetical protein [Luteolibacter soli]|uniref:DUF3987 domain-containing protein n=1 Tax=Luteolibacter soli TaxID=3135280 RepID=A0ABU9AZR3_9BACT
MKVFNESPPSDTFPITGCEVPESDWPPLLLDIISVWGGFAAISPESAAAILLTVTGGIVGGRVTIDAPLVGSLPPSLQLTILRDYVPLLRRAIQRMLVAVEGEIIHWLKPYEHLSDRRAQNNELASLETRLNALILRGEALKSTTENEREMMNAFCNQTENRILMEYEAVVAETKAIRAAVNALRFRIKAMMIVPSFGIEELNAMNGHSFDRTILEVSTSPGYFDRLARLPVRAQERLASFRRNSDWATRLEFVDGSYKPRSSVSSIVLATADELEAAHADNVLSASQLVTQYLVCDPSREPLAKSDRPDPGVAWGEHVSRLFSRRLEGESIPYSFTPDAKAEFLKLVESHSSRALDGAWDEQWESYPWTVAKIALCVRLLRVEGEPTVNTPDLVIAMWVAKGLIEKTREFVKLARSGPGRSRALDRLLEGEEPEESPLEIMYHKLKALGPCTRRTLFRAYSRQDYSQLVPVLTRLVGLGWVERAGKLYKVASEESNQVSVSEVNASVKPMCE